MIRLLGLLHALMWVLLGANAATLRRRTPACRRTPRLSVLIPARNEAANLRRLIPSLLRQTYPDFEVVVVDDRSEDDTAAVLAALADPRLRAVQGAPLPAGWLGKPHACCQAARQARGELLLFLDADTEATSPDALAALVARYDAARPGTVLTGLLHPAGGGHVLISLFPLAMLSALPWPFVRWLPFASVGALNGQLWLIDAATYRRLEPHQQVADSILEDVEIGRYLKRQGLTPQLTDARRLFTLHMYPDLSHAWRGLRKNAYLLLGGRPLAFVPLFSLYAGLFLVGPIRSRRLTASAWLLKAASDRLAGFPARVSALAPLSYLLGAGILLDSAFSHLTGRVRWKGRDVSTRKKP